MEVEQKGEASYLIVIFGPPASGKSTFARHLHQSYRKYCNQNGAEATSFMVSVDSLEEFLRNHSIAELQHSFQSDEGVQMVMNEQLKRSQFIEENWRDSRQFVRSNLASWLRKNRVVIVQDDMLLKSQRKCLRHIAEQQKPLYLEVCMNTPLQKCIANLKQRSISEEKQYRLSIEKCEEAFAKFELDHHPYLITADPQSRPEWVNYAQQAKIVNIEHPQLEEKQMAPEQNLVKDDVEVRIRRFVSELISNQELHKKYFKNADKKKIAAIVGSIKKKYSTKNKTFEGFLQFLKNETDSFH